METRRGSWIAAVAAALAALSSGVVAQEDISGTWAGTLAVGPGTELEIHFVLTPAAGGGYSAVVTSPDPGGVQNMPASRVTFESNRLSLDVEALSGAYEGTLADGTITGEWRQEGTSIPLALVPYEAPVLSQAAIDALAGEWVGRIETPAGGLAIVYRFEKDTAGKLVGSLDSPDQGVRGLQITEIEVAEGELSLRVPRVGAEYTATLATAEMTGTWSQQGASMPLNMSRGEFTPTVTTLDLSAEAMADVAGAWKGTLGPLEVVFRFEETADGDYVGYLDVPAQGASDVPITTATYFEDRLTVHIAAIGASYWGDVSGSEMSGEWTQGPGTNPLTLARQ